MSACSGPCVAWQEATWYKCWFRVKSGGAYMPERVSETPKLSTQGRHQRSPPSSTIQMDELWYTVKTCSVCTSRSPRQYGCWMGMSIAAGGASALTDTKKLGMPPTYPPTHLVDTSVSAVGCVWLPGPSTCTYHVRTQAQRHRHRHTPATDCPANAAFRSAMRACRAIHSNRRCFVPSKPICMAYASTS